MSSPRLLPSPGHRDWPALARRLAAALLAGAASLAAHAQDGAPAVQSEAWHAQMQAWLQQAADTQLRTPEAGLAPLRAQVEVGRLDSRLQLAPCARVEPYLPPNTRLWGQTRIGLRCTAGPVPWKVFLPVTVRVWGPGWVIRQPVAAGETLTSAHAELGEVEWSASNDAVLVRAQDWLGQQAVRPLGVGQVLRARLVRAPRVFERGAAVRLRAQGVGFTLTASGEALADGYVGESVRVRLPNRRVVVGTVVDGQTVDVAW